MVIFVAGVLYQNPFRDSLVFQRERGLVAEARLIADVFEVQISASGAAGLVTNESVDATLQSLELPEGVEVFVFDDSEMMVAETRGTERSPPAPVSGLEKDTRSTVITDALNSVWTAVSGFAVRPMMPRSRIWVLAVWKSRLCRTPWVDMPK